VLQSLISQRFARLVRKSRDLRNSGSSRRHVILYVVKYARKKVPVFRSYLRAVAKRRATFAAIVGDGNVAGSIPTLCVSSGGSGMGDDIVVARFMRDLHAATGPIVFDVATIEEARTRAIYGRVPGFRTTRSGFLVDDIGKLYTLALELTQVAQIRWPGPDRSALARHAVLQRIVKRLDDFTKHEQPFIARLPYTSAHFSRQAIYNNQTRATFLHFQSGIAYGGDRMDLDRDGAVVERLGLAKGRYITVHNGFDPAFIVTGKKATKCYPHFAEVIALLKRRRLGIRFVQIGTTTSTPIAGIDVDLTRRTSFAEVAALVERAELHIDNESGLVHLAAAVGTRSCVVFGPTDAAYFGYFQNVNLPPRFCGGCWWFTDAWMDQCPRGFGEARCMSQQPPEAVASLVISALRERGLA
jgi:hypothetical protein